MFTFSVVWCSHTLHLEKSVATPDYMETLDDCGCVYTQFMEKKYNLLFQALQASTSLRTHRQKEERSYTKKTISTHNWRATKELAMFEGVQSLSRPIISKIY